MINPAQEDIAQTVAEALRDSAEENGPIVVAGWDRMAWNSPYLSDVALPDGNSFVIKTDTGQRFVITVQED